MEAIYQFFLMAVVAITLENAVFSRGFGIIRGTQFSYRPRAMVAFCVAVIDLTLTTSLLTWAVSYLLGDRIPSQYIVYLRPILFFLCATVSYIAYYLLAGKFLPKYFAEFKGILPLAAFNCTVLGASLISANQNFSAAQWLGFGLGTGLGYCLASFVLYVGRRRLHLSNIPKAFQGLPIMLLFIGLVSLALYGLAGHQLPI